jgi:selenocysteine lyase/cysteine desulfurase
VVLRWQGAIQHLLYPVQRSAVFPNTPALQGAKALCVSHVYPTTGVRLPLRLLREKADELGIRYLVIDGAQAMVNAMKFRCPGQLGTIP